MKRILVLALLLIGCIQLYSQGIIRGTVVDETGFPLIGANVVIDGTTKGVMCDLDGNYSLEGLEAGTYTVVVSFISYQTQKREVSVVDKDVSIANFTLTTQVIEIDGATIEAKQNRANTTFMEGVKKKQAAAMDFISSQQIKKSGDGNASAALQRVPGVSTVGNFIFVRGLSDRYLKTTLNGAEIPSINPRRNTLEMDIFPTNLIDNLVVVKTQTSNLPADWAGAYLNVVTKDFPEEFSLNYSTSLGFNTNATFQDIISSERSDTDWIGYDNGLRDVPGLVDGLETLPTVESVCFYDALVYGGFEAQLADMGISECGDIGPLGVMSINEVLAQIDEIDDTQQLVDEYSTPLGLERNQDLTDVGQSFPNTWAPVRRRTSLNMSHSLSFGNQTKLFGKPFGYIFGFTYNNSVNYHGDGEYGRYAAGVFEVQDSLTLERRFNDERSWERVYWNALLNLSYKLNQYNKVSAMVMPNVSGQNSTRFQEGVNPRDTEDIQQQYTHQYTERNLNVFQVRGEHYLPNSKISIDWNTSYSRGKQTTPDLRVFYNNYFEVTETSYLNEEGVDITEEVEIAILELIDDGAISGPTDPSLEAQLEGDYGLIIGEIQTNVVDTTYVIEPSLYPAPTRYYRTLTESKFDAKLNVEIPLGEKAGKKNLVRTGLSFVRSDRRQEEQTYSFQSQGVRFDGDLTEYFADSNLVVSPNGSYIRTENLTDPINTDRGFMEVFGAYALADFYAHPKLRINTGTRIEVTNMNIRSDALDAPDADELSPQQKARLEGGLDDFAFLPTLNVIWQLSSIEEPIKLTNLRFGYSRTLARPIFREKSPFRGFNFETLEVLKGNPALGETKIDNLDLRIEHYPNLGEIISLSLFYKRFTNPIEQQAVQEALNTEITWVNIPHATVYGAELEMRKNLGFISESLNWFSLGANFSYIQSQAVINPEELIVIRSQDPTHPAVRPLFGQSPYIINTILSYDNDSIGMNAAIAYNVQGPKLFLVTKGGVPDIYQQPMPALDFTISKSLGEFFTVGFKARNLLNPMNRKTYTYRDVMYDWYSFDRGVTYSISLGLRL